MSIPVTELVTRVREYSDARDDGDDPYISDTAILAWLNQENRRLIRRVTRLGYAWGEVTTSFSLSTALSDVVAITGVHEVSGTNLRPIPRLLEGVSGRSTDSRYWTVTKSAPGVVTVSVGTSGSYSVRYIPSPPVLVTGSPGAGQANAVYYPPGWEEILVLGAALRVKAKEGSDGESPFIRQLYQDEWDDIEVEAASSDARNVVQNVDSASPPGWGGGNFVATTDWWWL